MDPDSVVMDVEDRPPYVEPPPVGIRPRWLVREQRIGEIVDAMARYRAAGRMPPSDWANELMNLLMDVEHDAEHEANLDAGANP